MKAWLFCIASFFATALPAIGQKTVLKSNSKILDIRDGDRLRKGYWSVAPEVPKDFFYPTMFTDTKTVVFYSDIDSIRFTIEHGKEYPFVVELPSGEKAYTIISTQRSLKLKSARGGSLSDTIPFSIGKGQKIYIKGQLNGSAELNFMFDSGSDQVVLSASGLKKVKEISFQETSLSRTLGGTQETKRSQGNKLSIGSLEWENLDLAYIENADADGIIGYNVFDGHILEINYDQQLMVVHDTLPAALARYQSFTLDFNGGTLPFVKAKLFTGKKYVEGLFEIDLGSNGSLWVSNDFATKHQLYNEMQVLGETTIRGADGNKVKNEHLMLPAMYFGEMVLKDIPIDMEKPGSQNSLQWCILGTDVLKRFNTVFDFRQDKLYLSPSGAFHSKFINRTAPPLWALVVGGILLMLVVLFVVKRRRGTASASNLPYPKEKYRS